MHISSLVLLSLLAQTTPPVATPEAKAKAQSLLKDGAKLYERGALAAALEKFNEAYEAYPSPKLLFNIGQASRDLGRPAAAMTAFERFLAEATDAPPDMTAEAQRSMAEIEPKLGKLRIQCATANAEISLDGKPLGKAPITDLIWAVPGSHQVTARHPDMAPAIEDVEVNASWVHTVVMTMQPLAKVVAEEPVRPRPRVVPAAELVKQPSPEELPAERQARGGRIWTWVAAGAAVVFAGSATYFGLTMQSKYDELNTKCGSGAGANYPGCSQGDIDGVLLRRNVANVSWGLAAAAAATAGVLFFVEGRTVSVAPMAGEATGLLAGVTY
jgi:hypothetical protein